MFYWKVLIDSIVSVSVKSKSAQLYLINKMMGLVCIAYYQGKLSSLTN